MLSFASFSVSAQNERKFQVWNYNNVSVDISDKSSISSSEKIQYTPFENGLDSKFVDLWFKHETSNWFEYAGGFRVLYSKGENGWIVEQRPMIMGTFSKELKRFAIRFSNRLEYRKYEFFKNHFRYKQRLDFLSPILTSFGMQFFASEETFTKLNSERTHLARLYAGVSTINKEHFAMKLYYVFEKNKKSSVWNTTDILGMNMSFRL